MPLGSLPSSQAAEPPSAWEGSEVSNWFSEGFWLG